MLQNMMKMDIQAFADEMVFWIWWPGAGDFMEEIAAQQSPMDGGLRTPLVENIQYEE